MPANNEVTPRVNIDDQGSRDLKGIINQLKSLQKEVSDTTTNSNKLAKSMKGLNSAFADSAKNTQRFTSDLGRAQREMRDTSRASQASADSMLEMSGALSLVASNLSRVGDFGARQFGNFIAEGAKLERLTASFKNLLGTTEAATSAIDDLHTASQNPGLTFEQRQHHPTHPKPSPNTCLLYTSPSPRD